MLINKDKFELLNFGKSANTFHYETPQGKQIKAKECVRDMGITFEPNGKFDKHITRTVAKLYGRMDFTDVQQSHKGNHAHIIKNISCTTSRIWSIIWMPTSQNSVNLIETIQRRFTKLIDYFHSYDDNLQMPIATTSHQEQPKMLNIYSLQILSPDPQFNWTLPYQQPLTSLEL